MVKNIGKKIVKIFDNFLKILKTDRNTFFTYILTLAAAYVVLDRLIEVLLIIFTGTYAHYWGPITYSFALACPIFAFLFFPGSKFAKGARYKIQFFHIYSISLYIVGISMVIQYMNTLGWLLFFSVPRYADIVANFPDLIKPAFSALAIYLPIVTAPSLFHFLYVTVNDTQLITDSLMDFAGLDLSDKTIGVGEYTCEVAICKDDETGKMVKIPESRRFESMAVVGVTGTGKTACVFEPMLARDIEKKRFFTETAKEMGYTALKTGIAYLNCPYDNKYINDNFSLNMITPNADKFKLYTAYMEKMIYGIEGDKIIYKNLGFTYIAPEPETVSRIKMVAHNYNVPVNIIDPLEPNSLGLNPFIYDSASKTAIAISSVLRGMYSLAHYLEAAYREDTAMQALENFAIILKEMYPRLHDGELPTLEDLLKMLNDFDATEKLCRQMEMDDELAEKYSLQLGYFKKYIYKEADNRKAVEMYVTGVITQLDDLLRYPGVKEILCNRTNNIDFEKVLKNGEVTILCTRRGELGPTAHKAFGLFFLLSMQYAVMVRPGNEKTRIPHFLYIDEFPDFICKPTEAMFTQYRKYRVGMVISAQNLAQFGVGGNDRSRQTILSNCTTKIVFGNNTPEDNEWWQDELGKKRDWLFQRDYDLAPKDGSLPAFKPELKGINWGFKYYFEAVKVQNFKFKKGAYNTRDLKGTKLVGPASVDFLEEKYKKPQELKEYAFYKYNDTNVMTEKDKENAKENNGNNSENDPIKTDATDSRYFFDNDDAVATFNIKKGKQE